MHITVYFLLTLDGKIIFNPEQPITTHKELINSNNLIEDKVAKLIYDPSSISFYKDIGIRHIEKSIYLSYNPLPFHLKKFHLNAIQNFIDKNEIIAEAFFESDFSTINEYVNKQKQETKYKNTMKKFEQDIKKHQGTSLSLITAKNIEQSDNKFLPINSPIKITKDTKFKVYSNRHGIYTAKAGRDFSLDEEWWPVIALEPVDGLTRKGKWQPGEYVPCRNSLNKLQLL